MEFLLAAGVTLVLLVLIVVAASVFTNAIEWLGHRFELSEGAVGSVLAAVGTALPETLVPIVALISGAMGLGGISAAESHEIGVGAILGAPFLLSTLAMFVTGVAVYWFASKGRRSRELQLDKHLLLRDFQYFFIAYGLAIVAGVLHNHTLNAAVAGALLVYYGIYVVRTVQKEHIPDKEFDMDPLMFAPKSLEPRSSLILMQTAAGLLGILVLAHLFVEQVSHLSHMLKINAMVLSLIIIPIATELPEKFNSIIWIGKERDNLALGNITGAMVFQSCIPVSVGMLFTPWQLSQQGVLSIVLCLLSAGAIYTVARLRQTVPPWILLVGGAAYLVFLVYSLTLVGMGKPAL